jgi:hypothetical protein
MTPDEAILTDRLLEKLAKINFLSPTDMLDLEEHLKEEEREKRRV